MIVGLLIFSIGLIPIVLAFNVHKSYEPSRLSNMLKVYMMLIACWQFYVGTLYFVDVWNKEVIEFFFHFFRIGPIMAIPVIYSIIYIILKDEPITGHKHVATRNLLNFLFNKHALINVSVWSFVVYTLGWTPLSVSHLEVMRYKISSIEYYYPAYGPLNWVFVIHMSSFVLFLILILLISKKIINRLVRTFIRRFALYSIVLFLMGMVNFYPEAGTIASSIGVVVFSTAIMFEFINFNHNIRMNYYDLLERQKKMDYTGNIAGSLIHEVKNANQIIKGFSSMLEQSETIQEKDHAFAEMISKSSQHLEELTENYKGYINASDVEYKMEDLEEIINESIQFSSEILKKHHISVHFVNQITPLMAYANKANLKQVFINLLKNSMEATPLEKEERDIYIETKVENNKIIIDFKDSGKGIPPSNWESVFDPFISLEKRGMGFGLPFVKKIIIEHLGDISIVSSSSKGTTFRIEIPQMGSFSRKD